MSYFEVVVTTAANKAKVDAIKTEIPLTKGIAHKVRIRFWPGPQGLTHVVIKDGLHQLWPTNDGGSFAGDDEVIDFKTWFDVKEEPYNIQAYTWNLDTANAHEVRIGIGVLPRWVMLPLEGIGRVLSSLGSLISRGPM